MKKVILIIACISVLYACKETPCDVKEDIEGLKQARTELQKDVQNLGDIKSSKLNEISALDEKLKVLNIYDSGRKPQYILKIHLKQSHFTLDIGTHMKDAANAVDFELPVDKEFYDQVQEGTAIVDNFRMGSFILEGSFGNWDMTVRGKEIR